ncbi:MAG: site-2 protease family protein [Gordonia sp. (in: high G+C Gram-positive bacteria)]
MSGPGTDRDRGPRRTPGAEIARAIRPGPWFLGLVAVAGLGAWLAAGAGFDDTSARARGGVALLVLAGWVISLCAHEFAHAVTAFRFGDRGVETKGYLTLNPARYAHPGLSLVLPLLIILLGGIGFPGGAVYLDERGFTRAQRTAVSLAGPAANLVIGAALLAAIEVFAPQTADGDFRPDDTINLWGGLAMLAFLQLTAAVLNLIPMPGFDGYGAIEPYLSPQMRARAATIAPFGFLIVFALLFIPALNDAFFDLVFGLFALSGVPSPLLAWGWNTFLFWR